MPATIDRGALVAREDPRGRQRLLLRFYVLRRIHRLLDQLKRGKRRPVGRQANQTHVPAESEYAVRLVVARAGYRNEIA
jgi:hypothetical protein